jgi:hypothetical protein
VRVAERKRAALIARFPELAQRAQERLEKDWVEAQRDFFRTKQLYLETDIAFMRRDDDREVAERLIPSHGFTYIIGLVSESGRAGSFTRYWANGQESKRVKNLLISSAHRLFVKAKEAHEAAIAAALTAAAVGKEAENLEAVPVAISADGNTIECAMVAEGTSTGAAPQGQAEPAPDAKPEQVEDVELDTLEADEAEDEALAAMAEDAVMKDGDYAGLPVKVVRIIKAAVRTVRANVVTIQIRSPIRQAEKGPIMNCKFGIASTKISLRDVVEKIRSEEVKVWGMTPEDPDLREAASLILVDSKGRRFRLDYRPEWDTYFGCWFKTNQTLPYCRLAADFIMFLVTQGMMVSDKRVRAFAAAEGLELAEPEWRRIIREGVPKLLTA